MKNTIFLLACFFLFSCVRNDMDLKTLQGLISKSNYTNKLSINDEMKFYNEAGKRDIRFEDYLKKYNVTTLVVGDFNHDGEEDYLANVSNNFNKASFAPSEYFPIIIILKSGNYFIFKLDKFFGAKSVGTKLKISDKDYILLFSKDRDNNNSIKKDTLKFENNTIAAFEKNKNN
ncbi:hypothetical protein [Epilithonimonas sp.]|uniref:hypothetical protein n=1 Tax=Epilithonimonas sp. TaxID=2894511 RepID=UPI0035AFC9FE